uniref:hypothetical protein n=1 Tax=Alistipes putredinis TaxID=28117 RepID=UPI003AB1DDB9
TLDARVEITISAAVFSVSTVNVITDITVDSERPKKPSEAALKKENYLIFPMQNMVMLCKVDSLVVNVIFHTSSKLYANVTSSKKCQVIKN